VGKQEWILRWAQKTNNNALQLLLGKKLEDLMMVIILGVMIGARLGDVIFYNL
jgi:prolipoprotein diacylglyceryltransferase